MLFRSTGVGNKDRIIDIVKKHATVNDDRVDERQEQIEWLAEQI